MKNINRRESPRIEIQLRCHVTSPALWVRCTMTTENMSRSGLLICWSSEGPTVTVPGLGQIITVEIELPANHGFGQKCIHCQGSVIRVIGTPESPKVALRVNYIDFRSFHDQIRAVEALTPVSNSWMA